MRLLVLGGTKFLGRHVVQRALDRGADVSIFTRGQTNPDLFPEAEHLIGDRDGDLLALEGRSFDAVVDTSGYVPRVVRASAELLRGSVEHSTFVSSVSVYADTSRPGTDETAAVATLEDPASEDVDGHYGALKAACERAMEEAMPGRILTVRAGLIVGPLDPTGRFTYWVHRIARGGDVLAPGPRDQPVQLIDVRDLAGWILDMAQSGRAGVHNATGPERPVTMEHLLEGIGSTLGSGARLVWVDEAFLHERGVREWVELPLWLAPGIHPKDGGFLAASIDRALAAGLRFRQLEETVRDTLAGASPTQDAGLTPERERQLLDEWAATSRP